MEDWKHGISTAGSPALADGGPLGAGDHYLSITSDAVGTADAGKLVTPNQSSPWQGNYTSQGITHVVMDLKAFSGPASDFAIRIAVRQSLVSSSGYVSSTPFTVPLDGQWHHAIFDLSNMSAVGTPSSLSTVLANVAEFRILHSTLGTSIRGDVMVANLGIDNISAVPEPSSAFIAAFLLLGYGLHRRLRTKCSSV